MARYTTAGFSIGDQLSASDAMSKTFQSFWQLSDGQINFSDDWPNLEALTATANR